MSGNPRSEMLKRRLDNVESEQGKLKELLDKLRVTIEENRPNEDDATCCKLEDFFHATHCMKVMYTQSIPLFLTYYHIMF